MPPVVAAIAVYTGTAVATGIVTGAVVGAVTAAVKGGNILKGALMGGLMGGVSAGIFNVAAGEAFFAEGSLGAATSSGTLPYEGGIDAVNGMDAASDAVSSVSGNGVAPQLQQTVAQGTQAGYAPSSALANATSEQLAAEGVSHNLTAAQQAANSVGKTGLIQNASSDSGLSQGAGRDTSLTQGAGKSGSLLPGGDRAQAALIQVGGQGLIGMIQGRGQAEMQQAKWDREDERAKPGQVRVWGG